jgi:transposase-like protein
MNMEMGIIKVEVNLPEVVQALEEFRQNRIKAFDSMTTDLKRAVGRAISTLLKSEMTFFLGIPEQSGNKRNGFKERDFALKGVGCIRIKMPQDRRSEFKSVIIKPNEQIDPRLKQDLAVLHLAGISTRSMAMISRRILGIQASSSTVSESLGSIEEKALKFLTRPIERRFWALFVDGTNFRIQRRGTTSKEPSLVVLGLDERNCFSIIAIEPGTKDNVDAWAAVFSDLRERGLNMGEVQIGIMDGLPGLERKFREFFPNSVTARCWVHSLRNACAKTPQRLSETFKTLAHRVMYAPGDQAARLAFQELKATMGTDAERAVHCLEKDLDSLLAHYKFDKSLWRALKTTNPIERVNKELKRRTKSMETLGEKTLQTLVAFTALRLEYNWQVMPVNCSSIKNMKGVQRNQIEHVMDTLIH